MRWVVNVLQVIGADGDDGEDRGIRSFQSTVPKGAKVVACREEEGGAVQEQMKDREGCTRTGTRGRMAQKVMASKLSREEGLTPTILTIPSSPNLLKGKNRGFRHSLVSPDKRMG